jgi:DNA-binding NtrC family response regulator
MVGGILGQTQSINYSTAIIYTAALDTRNYLREKVHDFGLNAICFEQEAVCFDNFRSIQPKFIIAETDATEVIWRFIFALHASRVSAPLLIVSNQPKNLLQPFKNFHHPVYSTNISRVGKNIFKTLVSAADNVVRKDLFSNSKPLPLFIGQSDAVANIRLMLPNITKSRDSVLITGEQGTGKELLARLMVAMSQNEKTFAKIDCRLLRPELLVNGWFQSTFMDGNGRMPTTIFLDRIDQLSLVSQAEMRLLIEACRRARNGFETQHRNDIRFIASTEHPIESMVAKGGFRKDLFYRLNVIPVNIPPLRDRKEDISLLMDHFVIEACNKMEKCVMVPTRQAREMLYMHDWPGNVKELQNQMRRVVESGSEGCLSDNANIPKVSKGTREYIFNILGQAELPKSSEIKYHLRAIKNLSLKGISDKFVSSTEKKLMKKALEITNWNRRKAAEILNISYKSMLNKMKAYDIN